MYQPRYGGIEPFDSECNLRLFIFRICTWLTVTMAVSRYIAICHPLRARQIIGRTFTVASLVAVFVVSVLFNVPRFLHEEPRHLVDSTGGHNYFAYPGPLTRHPRARLAYSWQ